MASAFSFGFSGDDIDLDNDVEQDNDVQLENLHIEDENKSSNNEAVFPAEKHLLTDWTTTLPSQISYNTLNLEAQSNRIVIGRRELFDVRTQLMAEDDDDFARHEELISGLEQGDLKPNFYEGGFKTWECSLDLAELLSFESQHTAEDGQDEHKDKYDFHFGNELSKSDAFHVIELGCGTAVPSLAVFAQLLSSSTPLKQTVRFTMADYNSTVLRLVTLSNFLLTWWLNSPVSPKVKGQSESDNSTEESGEGELEIDATLLDAFQADLASRGITLDFISGGWSAEFVQLILNPQDTTSSSSKTTRLILASETIYSPSSLGVFSETLLELLRNAADSTTTTSTALVAAKKVYFGVGGGVDEFLQVLYKQPLRNGEESIQVHERKEINSGGVKRVVLQVRLN